MTPSKKSICRSKLSLVLESKYFLPACLVLAFMLHIGWILIADIQQRADFAWYFARAQSISYGDGYVKDGGIPTAYWPVGYPAFLASLFYIFEPSELLGKMANLFLYLGMMVLSFKLAIEFFRSRAVAGFTVLALALYPTHILYSSLLISETLYTFLTLLGIWLLIRAKNKWWLGIFAGMIFGCATLTREVGWLVPLVAIFALYWQDWKKGNRKVCLRLILVVNAVMLLTIAPWTIRNYNVFGHFVPVSTNKGVNLFLGNNPDSDGGNLSDARVFRFISRSGNENEWEWEQICSQWAVNYIKTHPLRAIQLVPMRFYRLFRADLDSVVWNTDASSSPSKMKLLKVICQGYYMAIMLMFAAALYRFRILRKKDPSISPLPTVILWIIAYWIFLCLPTHGESRYHYPMMQFFMMYAGAMLTGFAGLKRKSTEQSTEPVELNELITVAE